MKLKRTHLLDVVFRTADDCCLGVRHNHICILISIEVQETSWRNLCKTVFLDIVPRTASRNVLLGIRKYRKKSIHYHLQCNPCKLQSDVSSSYLCLKILIVFRVQIYLKPYKDLINNEIEMKAIMVGSFTLYWGIVFVSDSANLAQINIVLLILLIVSNAYFISEWLLHLTISQNSKNKYLNIFIFLLSTILWRSNITKNQNLGILQNIFNSQDKTSLNKSDKNGK